MRCASCGHENPDQAKFCQECGSPFPVSCPQCGAELPLSAKFCHQCGQSTGTAEAVPPARDPRSYTPKHLADTILQSKSALEGERKQVTVLFADVKGSMELTEQVDPEEWHQILDRFFQILADGVHRFEGTINQYTGDGIMALFGAPIAHEDHAQRACYAALWLREEIRRYGDELRLDRGISFDVRIGLNSGEVIVGKIGDDLRMDYTAQGQTVGLAARMQQIAEAGKVYLTQHVAGMVEGFFQLRDLGQTKVRGVAESLRVYELENVGTMRTRLDVSRARGFSRFVGRADEMATLELALNRAQQGEGQVVGVVGEAGVGKSRLCLEFVERCRARDIRVLEAHCPAHGKTVPLLPIMQLLRSSFGITVRDRDQAAREKIAGRLLLLNLASDELLPLVFDFLGVPDPERPAPQMNPEARQRQLYSFVRRLVQSRSEREPAVLLFDDIQWIDAGSDGFLAQLVEATSGTKTLLLVNFRPEYHAEWMGKSNYQQLPLLSLGPEAIDELLRALLGNDPTMSDLRDLIRERTGGNPFFIEETVQSLVESRALEGGRGGYRLAEPVEVLEIPASVHVVLAARIDRLSEIEKRILQLAAVIGKEFSEPLLKRLAELPGADLAAALRHLQSAEFIREEALYPELEYAFKHPLTQEVAYSTQLSGRRAEIHAALARALEEIHSGKLDEQAALLAHHWKEAGEALTSARWHARAAQVAGVSRPSDAFFHWSKVRELLRVASPSPDSAPLVLEAIQEILSLGIRVGIGDEEAYRMFAEGDDLAMRGDDIRAQVFLRTNFLQTRFFGGNPSGCHELASEALALAERSGDAELRWGIRETLFNLHYWLGDLKEALHVSDELVELASADPLMGLDYQGFSAGGWTFGLRAIIETDLGRLEQAEQSARRCEQHATRFDEIEVLGWTCSIWAWQQTHLGNMERALALGRRGVEIAEKSGSSLSTVIAYFYYGVALTRSRRWREAQDRLALALQIARERGAWLIGEAHILAWLAESCLGAGEQDRARLTAEDALRAARHRKTRAAECQAHFSLTRVLRTADGLAAERRIEEELDSASELVEEIGDRIYLPQLREERAALAHLRRDESTRDHHLREARRLYTEMGATGHAERLARELGIEG